MIHPNITLLIPMMRLNLKQHLALANTLNMQRLRQSKYQTLFRQNYLVNKFKASGKRTVVPELI